MSVDEKTLNQVSQSTNKGIIYISFHPGSLAKYAFIKEIYGKEFLSILIVCVHSYTNPDIIKHYAINFDHVIMLPEIRYEINIFKLLAKLRTFLKSLNIKLIPILNNIETYHIISNASAYLPVNLLLSRLKHNKKCGFSISISDESDNFYEQISKKEIEILKTAFLSLICAMLRLYPVYFHKKLAYVYAKFPIDRMLQFNSPFLRKPPDYLEQKISVPVYNVLEPLRKPSKVKKNKVIIYGDTTAFDEYGCDLSYQAYKEKLADFFSCLAKYYIDCELIYKPHPLDGNKIMPGLDKIHFTLYEDKLISQLHLDLNIDRIRSCYSAGSFSLHYAASQGVPAYAFYKYLAFNKRYPNALFKNIEGVNPFFYNIKDVSEIGIIDSIEAPATQRDYSVNWGRLLAQN